MPAAPATKEEEMAVDSSGKSMDMDEVELTLRRFAMQKNDRQLTKLLNSMFTQPIEDSAAEDSTESEG